MPDIPAPLRRFPMAQLFMRAFTVAAMLGVGSLAILSLFGIRPGF